MTADDLNAPLGQQPKKRRWTMPVTVSQLIAGALAVFFALFVLWAVIADDPFGGEPVAVVSADMHPATAAKTANAQVPLDAASQPGGVGRYDGPPPGTQTLPSQGAPAPAANTKTVTIIDGKTGEKQEVVIPAPANEPAATPGTPLDQKFVEMTPHGPIPKIAADGVRPAEAFARPVKPLPGKPDAPRIAIIVGGLGVSATATSAAIAELPGPVTLGFMPYGADVSALVARARGEGHEVLLQVPMEPFDYPDNDPGPQTLLTTLAPEQNLDRLYWLMSRFQGYVGIAGAMGARFTASEPSFAPVLRETAKRGLIFVDDGSNPRSLAGRIAGANNMAFAKADVTLDSVPTAAEIDRALSRLEMAARERGVAVGISSALPMSIDHIAKWAKAAESRGLLLVPITAVALKAKQS
jgi:hypothetical protein